MSGMEKMNTIGSQLQSINAIGTPMDFLSTKKYLLVLLIACFCSTVYGQVGIGNPAPDSTSVLDLTNPNNKGLVLPPAANVGAFSSGPVLGITYFTDDHIYYKRSDGYNALSPWKYKFNGDASEHVYYNSGGNIGIGATSVTVPPEAPLQVQPDAAVSLAGNGTVMIGNSLGLNMAINSGELQARNTGSAAPLKINEDGGDITMGAAATPVQLSVTGKIREFHQPSGQYYDLIAAGTIVMWHGDTTNVPVGWALCNGNIFARSDNNGTLQTPDLRGRFIVGVGSNGTSTYAPHDVGGQDSVTLAPNELGAHTHAINLSTSGGGSHSHSMGGSYRSHDGNGGGGDDALQNPGSTTTSTDGNHSHTVNGNTQTSGTGDAHENRPSFHALVFIMKL